MSRTLSTKAYLALALGLLFVILSVVVVVLVNSSMRRLALTDSEQAARMLLDHNLAVHTYFSKDLKPKLFEHLGPITSKDYFEPVWMSSTYAVRKMDEYFHHFNKVPYYYKECAINARSPENEADNYEKAFLVDLQENPKLTTKSAIRVLDGKPYFTLLRRGEAMEESCLRCHSSPEQAPGDLVRQYGPERSFHRKIEDVVHAVSIRIPLSEAFSSARSFSYYLSGLLLVALGGGFLFVWFGNKRLLISPMAKIREHAVRIAFEHERLGETIPEPRVRELRDLVTSFNQMSVELRKTYDEQEQRILERTKDLAAANQRLEKEIKDRKKAQETLRESEDKFRNLFNNAEVGMFRSRLDGSEILDMNEQFLNILGRTREEMQGKPSVIHWADPQEREEMVRRLNTDGRVTDFECKMLNKQGDERICITSLRLYHDQGVLEGSIADITDRKRAEELALQSARLRAVADLSSGVAHHFNNLLQIIMASTSLSLVDLESGDLSEVKTNLEKMLEAASLGAETVKRLQTFANVRADVAEHESDVFDGGTTVRNAAEVSKPLWKSDPEKKGIKIELQLEIEDGCLVKGRENEIFEVLVNLIRNAAEAMPQGGDIEIKTYKEANEAVITVRDTGIGIAEEDLNRVFQPFWSSKGVGIGKGMGLAVTHGLVKRHGGTIFVQSKVGAGTTFAIRLPLAQDPIRKTEQPEMSTAGEHLTILVIEDELPIATLLERIFAKAGHRVFKTISGEEGLAVFHKEPVDLVICDLGMPGMNGWDVGKAIQSMCQERGITKPPFVLLTGWGGQELEREKIAESGTDAVVAKPIDFAALLATVQEIAARL